MANVEQAQRNAQMANSRIVDQQRDLLDSLQQRVNGIQDNEDIETDDQMMREYIQ